MIRDKIIVVGSYRGYRIFVGNREGYDEAPVENIRGLTFSLQQTLKERKDFGIKDIQNGPSPDERDWHYLNIYDAIPEDEFSGLLKAVAS